MMIKKKILSKFQVTIYQKENEATVGENLITAFGSNDGTKTEKRHSL